MSGTWKNILPSTGQNLKRQQLDETEDKSLIASFQTELSLVLDEISGFVSSLEEVPSDATLLGEDKKASLVSALIDAIHTKRVKNIKPLIEEIQSYRLEDADKKLFDEVALLVRKFKFKHALELLS